MDGGPFRMPQPAERRAASRPEPARRPSEEPQPIKEESPVVHRTTHHTPKEEKSRKWLIWPIVVVVVAIILGLVAWLTLSGSKNTSVAVDSSKYQAVFFTNGQVYFGKLHAFNDEYMKLTDIYYLQSQQSAETDKDSKNPQETSNDQGNVQLIKLGDEIHGPEDEMIISKDQVLFYENLKSNGKVTQSIEKHKQSN